jgi:hypothetical protein
MFFPYKGICSVEPSINVVLKNCGLFRVFLVSWRLLVLFCVICRRCTKWTHKKEGMSLPISRLGSFLKLLNRFRLNFSFNIQINIVIIQSLPILILYRSSFTWRWLKKIHGLSPRVNYTDRETAACRRSDCQLLRIKGATWSAWRIPTAVFPVF